MRERVDSGVTDEVAMAAFSNGRDGIRLSTDARGKWEPDRPEAKRCHFFGNSRAQALGPDEMIKYNLKTLIAEKKIRENRNITYREISSNTGISKVTLSKIAQSKGYDTAVSIVEKLCLFFKCTPNELITIVPDLPEALKEEIEKT